METMKEEGSGRELTSCGPMSVLRCMANNAGFLVNNRQVMPRKREEKAGRIKRPAFSDIDIVNKFVKILTI